MARGTMHYFGCIVFNIESRVLIPIQAATPALVKALMREMEHVKLEG
jgi:hypothetical protein